MASSSTDDVFHRNSANMMLMRMRDQLDSNCMGNTRDRRSPLTAAGILDHGSILNHRLNFTPTEDVYAKAQSKRATSLFLPFLDAVALMGGSRGGEGRCAPLEFLSPLIDRDQEMTCNSEGVNLDGESRQKKRLKAEQVRALEKSFGEGGSKLEAARKAELAQALGLQPRQVAIWFQNRRARSKAKHLEKEFALLQSQYHAVVAETRKLRSEVSRLKTELAVAATKGVQSALTSHREAAMPSSMSTNREDGDVEENNGDEDHDDQLHTDMNAGLMKQEGSVSSKSPNSYRSEIVVDGVISGPLATRHSEGDEGHDGSLPTESRFHNAEPFMNNRDQSFLDILQSNQYFHVIPYNINEYSYQSHEEMALMDTLW